MRLRSVLTTAVAAALMVTVPSAAHAASHTARDRAGDAPASNDIRSVKVSKNSRFVTVRVKYSKIIKNPDSPKATQVTVHYDTGGSKRPDHIISIDGYHWVAGSAASWYRTNPNEWGDPWGDWDGCLEDLGKRKLIKLSAEKRTVTVTAPTSCLGDPRKVRVAVSAAYPVSKDYSKFKRDYLRGKKRYTRWVR